MVEQYKRKPNTSCFSCEKLIYRRPSQIQRNEGRVFCGMKCYGISCRKESPCEVCGKMLLAGLNKKTCSRTCSNKYRIGIKYKIGRPKDKANSLRILKLRLMEKRGKSCERCGYKIPEVLQVHHKNKNRNDNSDKNLEIICPNCHFEEHYQKNNKSKGPLKKSLK